MDFISDFNHPEKISDNSLWFMICDREVMVIKTGDTLAIPEYKDLKGHGISSGHVQYMGIYNSRSCYAAEIESSGNIPEIYAFHPPLSLVSEIGVELVQLAGLAGQLITWSRNHKFCGKCGKPAEDKKDERAKICSNCGQIYYPRLSPAVIVAVTKGEKLLMANSPRFPSKFYSVLAGFVEPGETLEECVKREIREEVNIEVKNIKYFGSQPWPFPDSLMVGFTAEYAGGEIKIDEKEIADAAWFTRDEIPRIPPSISIARKLIDWFLENNAGNPSNI